MAMPLTVNEDNDEEDGHGNNKEHEGRRAISHTCSLCTSMYICTYVYMYMCMTVNMYICIHA